MTLTLRDWATGHTPVHRMDGRWKIAALMAAAVAVVLSQHWGVAALAWLAALGWLRYARLPWSWLGMRLGSVAGFLLLVALVVPVTVSDPAGRYWSLGPIQLSGRGLELAALITLRVLAVSSLALLLLATTPLDQLTRGLLGLRIPNVLVQLLSMSLRYVYVLGGELTRMRLALRTRAYRHRVSRHSYQTTACVLGSLVVRSQERAERIAQAMHCRGFHGQLRMLPVKGHPGQDAALALSLFASVWLVPWLLVKVWLG